jgi:competence protein ComEC
MPAHARWWLWAIALALGGDLARGLGAGVPAATWLVTGMFLVALARALGQPVLAGAALMLGLGAATSALELSAPIAPTLQARLDDAELDDVVGTVEGPTTHGAAGDAAVLRTAAGQIWLWAPTTLTPGDIVRATGRLRSPARAQNPGAVDLAQLARRRGVVAELAARAVEVIGRAPAWPWRWAAATGTRWRARIGQGFDAALVRGVVLGDISAVPASTREAWRAAGVYHALSVSGLHLAVVALLSFALLRTLIAASPLGRGRWVAALAAPPAIGLALAFCAITGAEVATLRAVIVVTLVVAARALARPLRPLDALALAAILLLLRTPSTLTDPSFQLSFTAAATLALVARRPTPRPGALARASGWLRATIVASAWVTATTAPITAAAFGEVAWGGVIGNAVVVPVLELLVLPATLLALLLGDAGVPLGPDLLLAGARALAGAGDELVRVIASATPTVPMAPPDRLELTLYVGGLAAVLAGWRRHVRPRPAAALALLAAAALVGARAARSRGPAAGATITFVDVGQGDATIIETATGEVWLIDAGGAPGARTEAGASAPGREVARLLTARGHRRVDVAIVSHPHPDHYLGLLAVAAVMPIEELWFALPDDLADERPGVVDDTPRRDPDAGTRWTFQAVAARLAQHGTRLVTPPLGVARATGAAQLEVLAPRALDDRAPQRAVAEAVRDVNDNSLIVRVEVAGTRVLLLGDAEVEGEHALLGCCDARADVVKVGHHGSRTSSTPALVAATGARLAVISVGTGNRFGLPDEDVLARWAAAGADVRRTDHDGAITVRIGADGHATVTAEAR